ncbi:hypothetical protein CMI41_03370 [Candidatus Pacearchaeota archaeon]|jgi:hypothetical protein|nr:hypothetical protein [Candidatus Pacearchaeota archaeon]|tara:strand:- start:7907 stop:8194 length:288 start_codon:yes stop_codon:yes gene_type:complete
MLVEPPEHYNDRIIRGRYVRNMAIGTVAAGLLGVGLDALIASEFPSFYQGSRPVLKHASFPILFSAIGLFGSAAFTILKDGCGMYDGLKKIGRRD